MWQLEILPDPNPSPTVENDPFAPDVSIFPPPPDWLFPSVMVALGVTAVVVVSLLIAWRYSVTVAKRERAQKPPTEWVDLSLLAKGGVWLTPEEKERQDAARREEEAAEVERRAALAAERAEFEAITVDAEGSEADDAAGDTAITDDGEASSESPPRA